VKNIDFYCKNSLKLSQEFFQIFIQFGTIKKNSESRRLRLTPEDENPTLMKSKKKKHRD